MDKKKYMVNQSPENWNWKSTLIYYSIDEQIYPLIQNIISSIFRRRFARSPSIDNNFANLSAHEGFKKLSGTALIKYNQTPCFNTNKHQNNFDQANVHTLPN